MINPGLQNRRLNNPTMTQSQSKQISDTILLVLKANLSPKPALTEHDLQFHGISGLEF